MKEKVETEEHVDLWVGLAWVGVNIFLCSLLALAYWTDRFLE